MSDHVLGQTHRCSWFQTEKPNEWTVRCPASESKALFLLRLICYSLYPSWIRLQGIRHHTFVFTVRLQLYGHLISIHIDLDKCIFTTCGRFWNYFRILHSNALLSVCVWKKWAWWIWKWICFFKRLVLINFNLALAAAKVFCQVKWSKGKLSQLPSSL